MTDQLETPVAFFVFNRPETTRRTFAAIAAARPSRLLVVADGPRPDHPGDLQGCAATRRIIDEVDWDCSVATHYAETNMGCRRRMSSGLDWVFTEVGEAVILEDDCLPHPTFFRFCTELLERYRDDERVAQIAGSNLLPPDMYHSSSYYFSHFAHIWGWATWRRAWRGYDVDIGDWAELRARGWLRTVLGDQKQERYWKHLFDRVAAGRIDTWDYQWTYAVWKMEALTAVAGVNLVTNIGYGSASTHTFTRSPFADVPTRAMKYPLRHPPPIRDAAGDAYTAREYYKPTVPRLAEKARTDPRGFLRQARAEGLKRLRNILPR